MKNRFRRAEEEAKAEKRGIWSRGAAATGSL
jgi:endonuclease YncB( thermonuclease family)